MRRKIAAGNWKMNGKAADLPELTKMAAALPDGAPDVLICPPATLLSRAVTAAKGTPLHIGAQDCHAEPSGAFTGDTAADMIAETGASHVILGHSERRTAYGEDNATVAAKAIAAWHAGLTAIICIGETLAQREADQTLDVIARQLAGSLPDTIPPTTIIIAYEPVWAIGTGRVPTLEQIAQVHDFIRTTLTTRFGPEVSNQIPLLYGGSVKPDNAATIFAAQNVDGALVGGASLKAADFAPIIGALAQS